MRLREGERGSSTTSSFQVAGTSKQQVGSYQIHMSKLDKIYNLRPMVSNTTKIAPQILEASNLRKQGLRQAEKRRNKLTIGRQAEIQRENAYLVKSIQQAQQRSSLMAKTLSVGVLQPRKFAAPGQKGFRTHKGFNVDSELEDQLIKIRHEVEGAPETKKPAHKLNQLGRLPQPGWNNKDSNRSVSEAADEANKTVGGFEVVFINPRASQEYGINPVSQTPQPKSWENESRRGVPSSGRSNNTQKARILPDATKPAPAVQRKTDGFAIELTALETCVVKVVWEDFVPVIDKDDDDESSEQLGDADQRHLEESQKDKKESLMSAKKDKNETLQTASTAAGSGEVIIEDLVSLKIGQTIRKEYSFMMLDAHHRKGVRFVLSLLSDDGSSLSSSQLLTKVLEKSKIHLLKTKIF